MITFQIAGYLTEFTGGRVDIKLDGSPATVGEALQKLWSVHAGLRDRVLTEQGHVRPHINVFVNSEVVRRDQVLRSEISGNTEICIMPAVSGGAEARASARAQEDLGGNNTQAGSVQCNSYVLSRLRI
jgi:molybdopterin synthase sulfur carrier subunit